MFNSSEYGHSKQSIQKEILYVMIVRNNVQQCGELGELGELKGSNRSRDPKSCRLQVNVEPRKFNLRFVRCIRGNARSNLIQAKMRFARWSFSHRLESSTNRSSAALLARFVFPSGSWSLSDLVVRVKETSDCKTIKRVRNRQH